MKPLFPTLPTPPAVQARLDAWLKHRETIRDTRTRLGLVGYAHLAALLVQQPSSVLGLMHRGRLGSHVAAYRFIGTLHALGYAHMAGWELPPGLGPRAVWAFGPGQDAPPPTRRPNGRPVEAVRLPKRQVCPGVLHFVQVLKTLEEPVSIPELIERTGLDRGPLTDCARVLVALELAHVPLWNLREQGGAPVPCYQLGRGRNAPMPARVLVREQRELRMARQRSQREGARMHQVLQALTAGAGRVAGGAA